MAKSLYTDADGRPIREVLLENTHNMLMPSIYDRATLDKFVMHLRSRGVDFDKIVVTQDELDGINESQHSEYQLKNGDSIETVCGYVRLIVRQTAGC